MASKDLHDYEKPSVRALAFSARKAQFTTGAARTREWFAKSRSRGDPQPHDRDQAYGGSGAAP